MVVEALDLRSWSSGLVRRSAVLLLAAALTAAILAPAAGQQSLPVPGVPAQASGEGEPSGEALADVSDEQVQDLIATLEDPARRQELIETLQALLAARTEAEPDAAEAPHDLLTPVLEAVSTRTEVVSDVAISIADSVDEIPALLSWLQDQVLDPDQRLRWRDVALHAGLMLGVGLLAYAGLRLALRRPRRRATHPSEDDAGVWRLPRLLGWLVLLLLPLVAFVAAISITAALVQPSPLVRAVMLPLLQGVVLAGATTAVARLLFAPDAGALRLLPLDDEAADYGFRATCRIAATGIYSYFGLEASRRLGLPWALHGFLLHLAFLVVLGLAIAVVLRCRQPVAAAIASLGDEERSRALRALPWRSLARGWHLLAIAYLAFVYLVWALKVPGGFEALLWGTVGTAVVAALGWWVLHLVDDWLESEPEEVSEEVEGAAPVAQGRAARYRPVVRIALRIAVAVVVAFLLLEIWGFGAIGWLGSEAGQAFGRKLLTILLVVGVTLALWEVASLAIERSISDTDAEGNLRLSNRTRTLLNITRNFLLVFLSLIALFLILSELGLNIAPLLAGAGVIGLAIGFGSQKLVQDIITGMFVLLADTIRVGDIVEVAGRAGVVERVTMRTVVLRDYGGNVHTIPYSSIDTVLNFTKEFSYAMFEIGVAYRESVDEVMEVMLKVAQEMNRDRYFRRLILEPMEMAGVDRFADSAVIIKARIKTRPLRQWEVLREYNRRLKNRFDELGIEIPFPHQTVYFGVDKKGEAPPARVLVRSAIPSEPSSQPEASGAPSEALAEPEAAAARARGG